MKLRKLPLWTKPQSLKQREIVPGLGIFEYCEMRTQSQAVVDVLIEQARKDRVLQPRKAAGSRRPK